MFGHFEPVNHCCFSPDDAYVSTASNDGTVKVIAIKVVLFFKTMHIKLYFNLCEDRGLTVTYLMLFYFIIK